MTTYDLGDGVTLEHLVYNADGELTDATVVFTVTAPGGAVTTPTVSRLSTGRYRTTLIGDELDDWTYAVHVSGAVTDVEYGTFTVVAGGPVDDRMLLFTKAQLVKWAPFAVIDADTYDLALDLVRTAIRGAIGAERYDALTDLTPLRLVALDLARRMLRNTDGRRSTSRQIDDYTENVTYASETLEPPRLTDQDVEDLWKALGVRTSGAFTIRPAGVPDNTFRPWARR